MNEEHKKVLTEYLGECWHEWECAQFATFKCISCEKWIYEKDAWTDSNLRSFTTSNDMDALRRKLVEKSDWTSFYWWSHSSGRGITGGNNHEAWHVNWLMEPERFCQLVADFLKERRKENACS